MLYVGKAKDLRRRVTSYRRFLGNTANKTGALLARVRHIETIVTATEKEAFLLEASLIKKHRPRYNVVLRDDKNYPYIKITVDETWPRLVVTRRKTGGRARYFGPFSSTSAMWRTIRELQRLFPLRRCKGRRLRPRSRPCLNFQMGKCRAPCAGRISEEEYAELVAAMIQALTNPAAVIADCRRRMLRAAEQQEYETAALYRDRIAALEKTTERQVVAGGRRRDRDVFGFLRRDGAVAVSVIEVRDGLVQGHASYHIPNVMDDDEVVLAEILNRYYGEERPVPDEILLPFAVQEEEELLRWLAVGRGREPRLSCPRGGQGGKLLAMARRNAEQVFTDRDNRRRGWEVLAADLRRTLHLDHEPRRVACIDISNTGGEQSVGAVVSFFEGEKDAAHYRHYKIRGVSGPDDYASMNEVLRRHLRRAEEGGFLPDLFLIDGGKGQLNIARAVLAETGYEGRMDLVGIAKEKEDEGEKLFLPGRRNPVVPARNAPVLLYLMRIRDEAHRYGITFHRRWRAREALGSPLDSVPGIGPARKQALLTHFGSLKRLLAAGVDEIAAVPGFGPGLAASVHAALSEAGNRKPETGNGPRS